MKDDTQNDLKSIISSSDLASLIVDALVDEKIVDSAKFELAVKIIAEEIDARKMVEDYWCSKCTNIHK